MTDKKLNEKKPAKPKKSRKSFWKWVLIVLLLIALFMCGVLVGQWTARSECTIVRPQIVQLSDAEKILYNYRNNRIVRPRPAPAPIPTPVKVTKSPIVKPVKKPAPAAPCNTCKSAYVPDSVAQGCQRPDNGKGFVIVVEETIY